MEKSNLLEQQNDLKNLIISIDFNFINWNFVAYKKETNIFKHSLYNISDLDVLIFLTNWINKVIRNTKLKKDLLNIINFVYNNNIVNQEIEEIKKQILEKMLWIL